ncbi:hypothetical protein GW17_00061581 [Ensete ventricosum]|nr:hypothetical protein GW17_00061581 [Ensete ventricosum]
MTVCRLAEVWERFCIPVKYELHVPLPGQRPYDAFLDGFLVEVVGEHLSHGDEKRPGGGGSEPRKKKMKVMVSKPPKRIIPKGTSEKAHHDKGKEPVEVAKSLDRPPTVRDLCKVDDQAGKDRYFIA